MMVASSSGSSKAELWLLTVISPCPSGRANASSRASLPRISVLDRVFMNPRLSNSTAPTTTVCKRGRVFGLWCG